MEENPALGRPMEDLNIPTFVLTKLYELGKYETTIGSVTKYSRHDLQRMLDRFGPESVRLLEKALEEFGLALAPIDYRARR